MKAVVFCALLAVAAGLPSAAPWQERNQELRKRVNQMDGATDSLRSLIGLEANLRSTIEKSDVDAKMKNHAHQMLDQKARDLIDLLDATEKTGNFAVLAKKTKRMMSEFGTHVKLYNRMVAVGSLPEPGPEPGQLEAALRDSTGIDTDSEDGALFRVLLKQFNNDPPREAFGVSAKFHADGTVDKSRYHIALSLPCASQVPQSAGDLRKHAVEAATALKSPDLVHDWINQVDLTSQAAGVVPGLGFGFAQLPDGTKAGKVYVMNQMGQRMPELPLSQRGSKTEVTVLQAVPALAADALQSQVVSLEWRQGDDRLVLRHYGKERGVSSEARIRKSTDDAALSDSLVHLLESVAGSVETSSMSAPFRAGDVGALGSVPAMVQAKIGVRVQSKMDDHQAFLEASGPTLDVLRVSHDGVAQWMEASGSVGHTVSNVQTGKDFVTLYRHPMELCYFNGGAKLPQRKNTPTFTACDNSIEAFVDGMSDWGGTCGACASATSTALSDTCQDCMTYYKNTWADANYGMDSGNDFPIYCWEACKSSWAPSSGSLCPSQCTTLIDNIQSNCGGSNKCSNAPEFEIQGGKSNKNDDAWFDARGANGKCNGDSLSSKACIEAMYASSSADIKTYTAKVHDGDIAELMVGSDWGQSTLPKMCRYPLYDWWSPTNELCNQCYSKAQQVEVFGDKMEFSPCYSTKQCNCPGGTCDGTQSTCTATCTQKCHDLMRSVDTTCSDSDQWCEPGFMGLNSVTDKQSWKSECFTDGATDDSTPRTYAENKNGGYIFDTTTRGWTYTDWENTGCMTATGTNNNGQKIADAALTPGTETFTGSEQETRVMKYAVKCRFASDQNCYTDRWDGTKYVGYLDAYGPSCPTGATSRAGWSTVAILAGLGASLFL